MITIYAQTVNDTIVSLILLNDNIEPLSESLNYLILHGAYSSRIINDFTYIDLISGENITTNLLIIHHPPIYSMTNNIELLNEFWARSIQGCLNYYRMTNTDWLIIFEMCTWILTCWYLLINRGGVEFIIPF